jgi:predicted ABC-type transport system involved in lysophospholipase L1 biosynthesis ATPase subunit
MTLAKVECTRASPGGRQLAAPARAVLVASGGATLELELDRGRCYRVLVPETERSAVIEQLSRGGLAAVVPADGGFIGNLKVWENIALPLAWAGKTDHAVIEKRVRAMLDALGVSGERFSAICRALPERLSSLELRFVAFARAMLIEPEIMVYDRLFEGLTQLQMEQAHMLDAVFRRQFPFRTSMYLESEAPPLPVQVDAEYRIK